MLPSLLELILGHFDVKRLVERSMLRIDPPVKVLDLAPPLAGFLGLHVSDADAAVVTVKITDELVPALKVLAQSGLIRK